MKTVEQQRDARTRSSLIALFIVYLLSLLVVLNFQKAYIQATNKTLPEVLNIMTNNINIQPFFVPTKEYLEAIFYTTMAFIIIGLLIVTEAKKYIQGKEYGSAEWATLKEKRKFQDKDNRKNIILSNEVKMSLDSKKTRKNLNVLILGGSGSGKTRFYVKPNLMALNTNYIVTDPKGELFIETSALMRKNGYKIKIFNTKDMTKTMHYNPFIYLKKQQDVFKFVKTLIKNTNEGLKSSDPFWDKTETAMMQAGIFYLKEEIREEDQTLPNLLKLLRCAKVSEEDENAKSTLDIIFENLEKEKGETIAVKQYKIFKAAAGKTAKSILISVFSRLAFLDISEVQEMLSYDEMELEKAGDEETIYYIIISDTDSSFNFLVAMLYTQMFDILCNVADTRGLNRPIRFILDEFANIGQIPDFEKVLATIRSRGISANVILQSIAQIQSNYKETWKSIVDNCDSTVFLGGKETAEYISKQLGKATIDNKNNSYSKGRNNSTSINESKLGRELMTSDEIQKMNDNDSIVLIRSCKPMYTPKYKIEKDKHYKELGDVKEHNNPNNLYLENFLDSKKEKKEKPSLAEILKESNNNEKKKQKEEKTIESEESSGQEALNDDLEKLAEAFSSGEISITGEDLEE